MANTFNFECLKKKYDKIKADQKALSGEDPNKNLDSLEEKIKKLEERQKKQKEAAAESGPSKKR